MNQTAKIIVMMGIFLLGMAARGFAMDAFSPPVQLNPGGGLPMVFSGSVNYVRGISNEYVYDTDTGEKISQLDWEIEDVVLAGGVFSVWFTPRAHLNLGLWAAVTEGNGYMQDWDWDSSLGSGWSHWSRSPVDLEDAYILDLNLGYDFQKLFSTKGDSHGIDNSNGDTWVDVDGAGAAHKSHSISLSAGIRF